MSTDSSIPDPAPRSGNALIMLGGPICVIGLAALMIFITIGHQREDPGPGQVEPASEAVESTPEKEPDATEAAPEGKDQAAWNSGRTRFIHFAARIEGPLRTGPETRTRRSFALGLRRPGPIFPEPTLRLA